MTTIEITDQMVDRAERWLCGHDAWELPYGSTGSGAAARTILEVAFADPPVRGSADGMVEPGPPKVDVPDMQAYESLSGLVQILRGEVEALEETVSEHRSMLMEFGKMLETMNATDDDLRERLDRNEVHVEQLGCAVWEERRPITEPSDPGAGNAEKWEAVSEAHEYSRTRGGSRKICGQIAVNEAVRQGLVHRIDPENLEQVRAVAVAVAMAAPERPSYCTAEQAKRILTALKGGAR